MKFAEARLGAGDAEIGHQREAEPAADRRAVNRADNRLLRAEQAHGLDVEVADRARVRLALHLAIGIQVAAIAEIGAGAEGLALRREHDRAAGGVAVERLEGVGQALDQDVVEEVVRRPADLDGRHGVGDFNGNVLSRFRIHEFLYLK